MILNNNNSTIISISQPWFNLIKSGEKTVICRINDKTRFIRVNDIITLKKQNYICGFSRELGPKGQLVVNPNTHFE